MYPLELLDQLLGGELRLNTVKKIIPNEQVMHRIVKHFISDGSIEVLDQQGRTLAPWEWDAFCREQNHEASGDAAQLLFRLTDNGAEQVT